MSESSLPKYQRYRSARRSFINKSIVASIAASNVTMFSGLVNAKSESASDSCYLKEIKVWEHGSYFEVEPGGTVQYYVIDEYNCTVIGEASLSPPCLEPYCQDDEAGKVRVWCGAGIDGTKKCYRRNV